MTEARTASIIYDRYAPPKRPYGTKNSPQEGSLPKYRTALYLSPGRKILLTETMLKGVPVEQRDTGWHQRHLLRLMKDKARRSIDRRSKVSPVPSHVEHQFQEAQERERQRKAPPLLARWLKWLWLRFISLRVIVWVRKLVEWNKERQYRGTK